MSVRYLRDLLYFDFDKATSLWSQLAGGLREKVSVSAEAQKDRKGGLTIGIPKILEATIGGSGADKKTVLESKLLHHDLLNLLEESLTGLELAIDLNRMLPDTESSADSIREAIGAKPYVIAQGYSAIEDYHRIRALTDSFTPLAQFIATCGVQSTPEVQQLLQERFNKQTALESEKDKHKQLRLSAELQRTQDKLHAILQAVIQVPDKWLLDGIRQFIDTFMKNRINFRIFPFEKCPSFQLICNLKRNCFVDEDLEHLLYGYSNRPTVPLTVFGLVTAIPAKDSEPFDPLKEFHECPDLVDEVLFEKAFREMFQAIEGLEKFV